MVPMPPRTTAASRKAELGGYGAGEQVLLGGDAVR